MPKVTFRDIIDILNAYEKQRSFWSFLTEPDYMPSLREMLTLTIREERQLPGNHGQEVLNSPVPYVLIDSYIAVLMDEKPSQKSDTPLDKLLLKFQAAFINYYPLHFALKKIKCYHLELVLLLRESQILNQNLDIQELVKQLQASNLFELLQTITTTTLPVFPYTKKEMPLNWLLGNPRDRQIVAWYIASLAREDAITQGGLEILVHYARSKDGIAASYKVALTYAQLLKLDPTLKEQIGDRYKSGLTSTHYALTSIKELIGENKFKPQYMAALFKGVDTNVLTVLNEDELGVLYRVIKKHGVPFLGILKLLNQVRPMTPLLLSEIYQNITFWTDYLVYQKLIILKNDKPNDIVKHFDAIMQLVAVNKRNNVNNVSIIESILLEISYNTMCPLPRR